MKKTRTFSLFLVLAVILLTQSTAQGADMSGRWRGRWESVSTGHKGPLNARFRQVDADSYRVVFHGRFALVVPFVYTLPKDVKCTDGYNVYFAGEKRLGPLGKFEYTARADQRDFVATYRSRKDHGQFVMRRGK